MKTLLLMRHAKSSWKHLELADAERGLAKRGKKDAPLMGGLLKEKELVPESILCSTAERSRETKKKMAPAEERRRQRTEKKVKCRRQEMVSI